MFSKIRGLFSDVKRAMSSSTVDATAHALGWAVYADGSADDKELASAQKFVERSDKLASVRGTFVKQFDKVLDGWEESPRQARVQAKRVLESFAKGASKEDKEDLMMAMLDLFESDGNFDDDEKAVAKEVSTMLDLDLAKLM
ncbi:MAG: TerB family tellurite resistance protein [Bacteroidales bacterium]